MLRHRTALLDDLSPWPHRLLFISALGFYAAAFVFDPIWFMMAIAMWWPAFAMCDEYGVAHRRTRSAHFAAQMEAWERSIYAEWRWRRTEYLVTPEWML